MPDQTDDEWVLVRLIQCPLIVLNILRRFSNNSACDTLGDSYRLVDFRQFGTIEEFFRSRRLAKVSVGVDSHISSTFRDQA